MPMSCDNWGVNSLQVSSKTLPYTSLRGKKKKKSYSKLEELLVLVLLFQK